VQQAQRHHVIEGVMRRIRVALWLAFAVLACGYPSPAGADTVFKASAFTYVAGVFWNMSATATLNRDETEVHITALASGDSSPTCRTFWVCYDPIRFTLVGPGVSIDVGRPNIAPVDVPLSPEQALLLKADKLSIVVTYRLNIPGGPDRFIAATLMLQPNQVYILAEGATGSFFDTDILIVNPNDVPAPVEITYLPDTGGRVEQHIDLPAWSRATVRVDALAGLESTTMSARVRSINGVPLAVERTMRWDATGYGGHTEKAISGPRTRWYFAEGAQGFFRTYVLLANPNAVHNSASIRFLGEGMLQMIHQVDLAPFARTTVDLGTIPGLQNAMFGIDVTFVLPGVAERAMYVGDSPLFSAGDVSLGLHEAATTWLLAEGATGSFFETFILVGNPTADTADVTVNYFTADRSTVTRAHRVPASGRLTINPEAEGIVELADTSFATQIISNVPVVVERAQYWPGPAPQWYGMHTSAGVSTPGTQWALAEGRVGGPEQYQTYLLLVNAGTADAAVRIRFMPEGGTFFDREFLVPMLSRVTLPTGPGTSVPELENTSFAAYIESTHPIAIERSLYWNANGQLWAAGTSTSGTAVGGASRLFQP
jgi:hypothetical protein